MTRLMDIKLSIFVFKKDKMAISTHSILPNIHKILQNNNFQTKMKKMKISTAKIQTKKMPNKMSTQKTARILMIMAATILMTNTAKTGKMTTAILNKKWLKMVEKTKN